MPQMDELRKFLIQEFKELKIEVSEIRKNDIPSLRIEMAVLKKDVSFSSKLYASIGAALAIIISIAMRWIR